MYTEKRRSYEKFVHKMLMKLTPVLQTMTEKLFQRKFLELAVLDGYLIRFVCLIFQLERNGIWKLQQETRHFCCYNNFGKRLKFNNEKLSIFENAMSIYHKVVETFHVVSECNTAIYFSWCLIQVLAQPIQLFWQLVTFNVAFGDSLTDSDLQLFIETEQDRFCDGCMHD
jgi:hypothetical protein